MLSSLVEVPETGDPSPEDVLSSCTDLIYPNEPRSLYGDAGSSVTYKSRKFGNIELELSDPQSESSRKLFAHYLWKSGVLLAELIGGVVDLESTRYLSSDVDWSVAGEDVLEIGAGTGVGGIVAALSGAKCTAITDYPAPEILTTLRNNVARNASEKRHVTIIHGHEWGVVTDGFSVANARRFTRILCADCLWMIGEHLSLVHSMLHFLSLEPNARVWIVAGFHTGRAAVASFFDVASNAGLEAEKIWERDVNGNEREWLSEKDSRRKDVTERSKWHVIAILRR